MKKPEKRPKSIAMTYLKGYENGKGEGANQMWGEWNKYHDWYVKEYVRKDKIEVDAERLEPYIDDWIAEWATAKQEIDNPVGLSSYLVERLKESFRDIIKAEEKG